MTTSTVPPRLLPVSELHRLAGEAVALMEEARRIRIQEASGVEPEDGVNPKCGRPRPTANRRE